MSKVLRLVAEQVRVYARHVRAIIPMRLAVGLAAIAVLGGCQVVGPAAKVWVLPESAPDVHDAAGWTTNRVRLAGAIGEVLSFRFAWRSGGAELKQPDIRITPLRSSDSAIDPAGVQLFRLHRVRIEDWPGWHVRTLAAEARVDAPLDALVPLHAPIGGLPAALKPEETYYFWADLTVPKGVPAGAYVGGVELTSRGKPVGTVNVELTVWPFVLPETTDRAFIAEVDHLALCSHHLQSRGHPLRLTVNDWQDQAQRDNIELLVDSTIRLLRNHRLNPVLPTLTPRMRIEAQGDLVLDWGGFDRIVEPCLNGQRFVNRIPLQYWPIPAEPMRTADKSEAARLGPAPTEFVGDYLRQCSRHFADMGWSDRSYLILPAEPPPGKQGSPHDAELVGLLRRAAEGIPLVSRRCPQDLVPLGWIGYEQPLYREEVGIWMPPAQFFDAEIMAAERAAGRRTWVTIDRPPFSGSTAIHAGPSSIRVLGQQVAALEADAVFVGPVNHWPDAEEAPDPNDCVRFDPGALLYPGRPFGLAQPVASVRLKYLRRSLQDAAYGDLLNRHGLEDTVRMVRESLVRYSGSAAARNHFADGRPIGWPDDPSVFEAARRIMAQALLDAAYRGEPLNRSEILVRTALSRRFANDTQRLRVYVDGARIRSSGSYQSPTTEVEGVLTLVNRTDQVISGSIRFMDLPDGWRGVVSEQSFSGLAPGQTRRLRLQAETDTIPAAAAGFVALPLELDTDRGENHRFFLRVCCVHSRPIESPIRVDGDLQDWPAGVTNVAAEFVPISGDPITAADARPRSATVGLVMSDAEHLYLAVNCSTPRGNSAPTAARKTVRYDDLIPMGEELVEILLDPYNTGTRSPADLFHIVVKRTGSDLTEKGIRFSPPCGMREPWPADIEVATRAHPDQWTVELRIPLSAFEAGIPSRDFWGLNITRFDLENQEFSTWSGAVRNAYTPASLGNLYLP